MDRKKPLIEVATKLDMLRMFRNNWLEKLVANEIDLKMALSDKIITSGKGTNAGQIVQIQSNVKRATKFLQIVDQMIAEEQEKKES